MRPIPHIVLTILVVAAVLGIDGALRGPTQRRAGAPDAFAAFRARLDGLQARVDALGQRIEARHEAPRTGGEASGAAEPRLHAPPEAPALDEKTLARWNAGLEALRAERLRQDERRFVIRRLRELEIDLVPEDETAVTGIVLAYFRARTELWLSLRLAPRDPVTAQGLYDDLTRDHHQQLAQVLSNARQAQVIASALMPLR